MTRDDVTTKTTCGSGGHVSVLLRAAASVDMDELWMRRVRGPVAACSLWGRRVGIPAGGNHDAAHADCTAECNMCVHVSRAACRHGCPMPNGDGAHAPTDPGCIG